MRRSVYVNEIVIFMLSMIQRAYQTTMDGGRGALWQSIGHFSPCFFRLSKSLLVAGRFSFYFRSEQLRFHRVKQRTRHFLLISALFSVIVLRYFLNY